MSDISLGIGFHGALGEERNSAVDNNEQKELDQRLNTEHVHELQPDVGGNRRQHPRNKADDLVHVFFRSGRMWGKSSTSRIDG